MDRREFLKLVGVTVITPGPLVTGGGLARAKVNSEIQDMLALMIWSGQVPTAMMENISKENFAVSI